LSTDDADDFGAALVVAGFVAAGVAACAAVVVVFEASDFFPPLAAVAMIAMITIAPRMMPVTISPVWRFFFGGCGGTYAGGVG